MLKYVPNDPRYLEDPWQATLKHSLDARNFVEDVYRLDLRDPFQKQDDQEAHELVCKRMAAGAAFLRDLAHTAWIDSAKPVPPVKPIDLPENPDNPKYNPATGSAPAPAKQYLATWLGLPSLRRPVPIYDKPRWMWPLRFCGAAT